MPTAPKHPCNEPGCPALVQRGQSRCPAHTHALQRRFDATRLSPSKRGYGRRWEAIRDIVLSGEPLCREHARRGETVAATDVDHIIRRALGGSDNEDNLQPLCAECHGAKTAREVSFAGSRKAQ